MDNTNERWDPDAVHEKLIGGPIPKEDIYEPEPWADDPPENE